MIKKVLDAMTAYYKGDPKRIHHFIKVYTLAHYIGIGEGLNEKELYTLDIAALVHDIGIKESRRLKPQRSGYLKHKQERYI